MPASEPVFLGLNEGTWFAVVALLLAMVISIVATVVGFWSASKDRESRYDLSKEDRENETLRIREQWEREDKLAQQTRVRDALVRDLHATRNLCLATLSMSIFQAMGGVVDAAAQRELIGEKYPTADPGWIGDQGTVAKYSGVIGRLAAHARGTPVPADLMTAFAEVTSAIRACIRDQELRAIRDETPRYVAQFRASDMTADDRAAMVSLGMLSPAVASYLDDRAPAVS